MVFRVQSHANGTFTLVDETNGQAMHSRIGPKLESHLVYAERARIESALDDPDRDHVLYDVGMGTAANAIAALDRIRERPAARGRLEIASFETNPDGLRAALAHPAEFPELGPWREALGKLLENSLVRFRVADVEVRWRLFTGDFYERLAEAPAPDSIFFDFYAPRAAPDLWSRENLAKLRGRVGERPARLFTYSAATPVRLNLLVAGFYVGAGVATGAKHETTIAATRLDLLEAPLGRKWLAKLETSASIAGPEFAAARAAVIGHAQFRAGPN